MILKALNQMLALASQGFLGDDEDLMGPLLTKAQFDEHFEQMVAQSDGIEGEVQGILTRV